MYMSFLLDQYQMNNKDEELIHCFIAYTCQTLLQTEQI